jgi:IS5 family transposase
LLFSYENLAEVLQENLPDQDQLNFFTPVLKQIINPKHALCVLSEQIDWTKLEVSLSKKYNNDQGRPAKPIRLMSSLLILKYLYDLSDEELIEQWIQNPYYQYFGGMGEFQWKQPCASSELVHFRYRIGKEGEELLFAESINIHKSSGSDKGASKGNGPVKQKRVYSDTTVEEKNITYPTDTKLYKAIIKQCRRIAEAEQIKLRQSYQRTVPKLMLSQRFRNHPKNRKKALAAQRKLKTIAGRLLREIDRQLPWSGNRFAYQPFLQTAYQVLCQQKDSKDKIYSIHEPHVYCISKGKEAKKYEYGCKVNIVWGENGLILAANHLKDNVHDSKVIEPALEQFEKLHGYLPKEFITDRGYRGKSEVKGVKVCIPRPATGKSTPYQKRQNRNKFRKRAGIEPIISHLKSDFRLSRNFLAGVDGDRHNLMMAVAAFNFRKWIVKYEKLVNNCLIFLRRLWSQPHRPTPDLAYNPTF